MRRATLAVFGWLAACSSHATTAPERDNDKNIALSDKALAKNPVATERVTRAALAADLEMVGSVTHDQDRFAVVGPLIAGRVARLAARVGDNVRAGQILADIESAEVGQAHAGFLSAKARTGAAQANLTRERELAEKKISSARERELAEAHAIESQAELDAATQRLRALGLSPGDVATIDKHAGRVPLRAPIAGTVVLRKVTLGQAVERASDAFQIVDLDRLWVLLDLYEKDLQRVHVGQKVELRTEASRGEIFHARVGYINPIIDEKTRTANVRIELDNKARKLRPGEFVTAKIFGDPKLSAATPVLSISRRAVVTVEGQALVFLKSPGRGFERRQIEVGPSGGDLIEVRRGLAEGDEVASDGAFLLKSEMLR